MNEMSDEERKREIDKKLIANGLHPWWSHLSEEDQHDHS